MRKPVVVIGIVSLALLSAACEEKATDAEIEQSCQNLVKIRGDIDMTPLEPRVAAIEKEYAEKLVAAKAKQDEAVKVVKVVDAELKTKLAEAKKDDDKKKIEAEYAAKKAALAAAPGADPAAIEAEKKTAIDEAKVRVEDAKTTAQKALQDCKFKEMQFTVSKAVIVCRIQAPDTDTFWNKCK